MYEWWMAVGYFIGGFMMGTVVFPYCGV